MSGLSCAGLRPQPEEPNSAWSAGGPLPTGSYLARNLRQTEDPFYWKDQGGAYFGVVRPHPNRPRPPYTTGVGGIQPTDPSLLGWLGLGPERLFIDSALTNPVSGDPAASASVAQSDLWVQFAKNMDPARKQRQILGWRNGTGADSNGNPLPVQVSSDAYAGIKRGVSAFPNVDVFIWRNEPGGTPGSWYLPEQQQLYAAVKEARPSALVGGFEQVDMTPAARGVVEQLFAAGGGAFADVMTTHAYPDGKGHWASTRKRYRDWNALLYKYGQHGKPKWLTEAVDGYATEDGIAKPWMQIVQATTDLMGWEQSGWGIPGSSHGTKEQWSYFYALWHGHFAQDSFLINGINVMPLTVLMYHWGAEVHGCPTDGIQNIQHVIDFGSLDNFVGGHVYLDRPNGTTTAVLKSMGERNRSVRLRLTGDAVASLQSIGWGNGWGREGTSPVQSIGSDYFIDVNLPRLAPVFLRLPDGVDRDLEFVEPVARGSKTIPVAKVFNGPQPTGYTLETVFNGEMRNGWTSGHWNFGEPDSMWMSSAPLESDANNTFTVLFRSPIELTSVMAAWPTGTYHECEWLAAHLEVPDGSGGWVQVGDTYAASYQQLKHYAPLGMTESRDTTIRVHETAKEFHVPPGTVTDRVRIVVDQTSIGDAINEAARDGHGIPDSAHGGKWKGGNSSFQNAVRRVYAASLEVRGNAIGPVTDSTVRYLVLSKSVVDSSQSS
jgi:hypothetical protein